MSAKTKIAAILGLLVLVAGVVYHEIPKAPVARSQTAAAAASTGDANAGILGTYYFKGIGLMEIRQEGARAISDLYNEEAAMDMGPPKPDESAEEKRAEEKFSKYRHHGRLVGPNHIEFDDADLTRESLLKRFGFTAAEVPADLLLQMEDIVPADGLGRYYEHWQLLKNNSLRIECAIPIYKPTVAYFGDGDTAMEFMEALRSGARPDSPGANLLDAWAAAHPANLKCVCGWKITNESERKAWHALNGGDYAKAAQLFQAATQEQPGWPFPSLGEAWARIGTKEFDLARKALQAGRDRLSDETRPWLMNSVYFLKDQIYSYETAAAGPEVDFIAALKARPDAKYDLDLPGLRALLVKPVREWDSADLDLVDQAVKGFGLWDLVDKTDAMRGRADLMEIGQGAFEGKKWAGMEVPNFLALQDTVRMIYLRGRLSQAHHEYPEAVTQYVRAVRLGHLMHHGYLASYLIGAQMENIGLTAIVQLFEDGLPSDAQTFQTLSRSVDALDRDWPRLEPGELGTYESNLVNFVSDPMILVVLQSSIATPNFRKAETRFQIVEAKLALVKAACAVKAKSLKPPYPAAMDAAALPEDVFAPGQPLHYRAAGNEAVLYSVGPDRKDDGGDVTYDPTNGSMSAGDVVLTIR